MNLDKTISTAAQSHAAELNKSIIDMGKNIAFAILLGLSIIAIAIRTKK